MSTTITYKDNLLTTVDNSIKILRTAGKYLEGDIVVADITAKSQANENDPIRFFDYDGTLVASYTEVPKSLPEVPTHEGLTNGVWNYSLQDLKAQFDAKKVCDIGANYWTASGKTEIDIEFPDSSTRLSPYLYFKVFSGVITVDWGDDSPTETFTRTSIDGSTWGHHTYATPGKYTITFSPDSTGSYGLAGRKLSEGNGRPILCNGINSDSNNPGGSQDFVYSNCIKAVRIGKNCLIESYAFTKCSNLASITIPASNITDWTSTGISAFTFSGCLSLSFICLPSTVKSIYKGMFNACWALKSISIPYSVTDIGASPFTMCANLSSLIIPNSVSTIESGTFNQCVNLAFISMPDIISSNMFASCVCLTSFVVSDNITNIGASTFAGCSGMSEYHFKSTIPPTLADDSVFSGIPSDCKIYVPYSEDHSVLNAYKTAENWSEYAKYIVEEGE